MGSILNAECVCGYKREGLFAGAGMLDSVEKKMRFVNAGFFD